MTLSATGGRPILINAATASDGIVRSGQFEGTRNHPANFSRLVTEKVLPSFRRLKKVPLLATIVATRASDFPPHRATSDSYDSATVRNAFSYASFMTPFASYPTPLSTSYLPLACAACGKA